LRQLVSREPQRPQRIQISKVLQSAMELVKPKLKYEGISVSFVVPDDLPLVFMEPAQLEQIFLNLLCNAADAMASDPRSRRELAVVVVLNAAREVEVSISDTGPGLATEWSEQVFEPFFSTKRERLGLGLAISRSIIKNHGGRLWFIPHAERGVTFHFTLPTTDKQNEQ
jgi:C4-dicarboxylate-specific signal transduction histidine kinase